MATKATTPAAKTTAKADAKVCICGCKATVKNMALPGHDARALKGLRLRYEAGEITAEQAQATATGWSPKLGAKFARTLELSSARAAARAAEHGGTK